MNETLNVIDNRRSLRGYDPKPISKEHKDLIIHSSMRAPTAGNMMHYSIIDVADPEKKNQLVKTCDDQPFIARAPLVLLFLADLQRWYDFFEWSRVPEMCEERQIEYSTPEESDLLLACCDALVAAENAVIAAESLGIGSCYIGDIMENIETHRRMFDLPRWVFPIALLCFGYPTKHETNRERSPRFPETFVYFKDRYSHIEERPFNDMLLKHFGVSDKFYGDAKNIGQSVYLRKTGSTFAAEMRRSVKVALKDWTEKWVH